MAEIPKIPGYRVTHKLAEGGMAAVYLGIQENLDRKVAIKILDPLMLRNQSIASRFTQEARVAAKLSHSNIIQIFDTGIIGNYHYIVMEYLEETLKERLHRLPDRRMNPDEAIEIVKNIIKALDFAHLQGIYHRDIKPENIMFKKDNTPVLVDFGIARLFDSADRLTKTGTGIGTVYYMSPEQCSTQGELESSSDIYSLGVVLFEMLTGDVPYFGETPISIALKHLQEPIPSLPPDLARYQPFIDKMMAKNSKDRISNGAQFFKLFEQIFPTTATITLSTIPIPTQKSPIHSSPTPDSIDSRTQPIDTSKSIYKTTQYTPPSPSQRPYISTRSFTKENKLPSPLLRFLPFIAGIIIIIILAIIFFPSGKKIKPLPTQPIVNSKIEEPSNEAENLIKAKQQLYWDKLNTASELIEKSRMDRAEIIIRELKQIKITPQLTQLESRIKELNKRFNEYMDKAFIAFREKKYTECRFLVEMAKKIKMTEDLRVLQESLQGKN